MTFVSSYYICISFNFFFILFFLFSVLYSYPLHESLIVLSLSFSRPGTSDFGLQIVIVCCKKVTWVLNRWLCLAVIICLSDDTKGDNE